MSEIHVSHKDLGRRLKKDLRALTRRVKGAVKKTAREGVKICRQNVPAEFMEIAAEISLVDGPRIRSHAPHSAAVEVGPSGFQIGNRRFGGNLPDPREMEAYIRKHGSGRSRVGKGIRKGLRGLAVKAKRGKAGHGRHSPIDAPRQLAFAILNSLKKHRKPHRFMQASVPAIEALLDTNVQAALEKSATAPSGSGGESASEGASSGSEGGEGTS